MPAGRCSISHVITRLIVGGAQENTLASVLGLREDPAFEISLVSGPTLGPEGSLEPLAAAIPGLLTLVPSLIRPVHPWHDSRALFQLTRLFRQRQPQIVHTHSGKAGFLGRLAARQAAVPVVVHTIHGPSFGPFQGPVPNLIFRAAERIAGRRTHHFVVVAEAMRDLYLSAGIGRPDQYTRIFSGFVLDPFLEAVPDPRLRSRLGIQPGDCVVGMIARLFRLKGHDDLLEAAPELLRRCPQLRFLLIGDGLWRNRLEAKARQLGIHQRVIFTGLVPPDAIPAHLALMDLLVHLSRREGLPRALPQALAAGRPVVAYDCDGAREVCRPGESGFLVDPGDRATLVHVILRLTADPALRQNLGARGQALVSELFPVRRMVRDLAGLYRQLTGADRP
jgi:glycosyltransferase involved in cell wall biosynthesis